MTQDTDLKRNGIEYETAVIRILDKMVARTRDLELKIGDIYIDPVSQLSILVRTCRKPPLTERPEVAVYLEITDTAESLLFAGWMLASAPALSALEHPMFDIWSLDCRDRLSPPS